jgi:hypothetical protein
VSPLPLQKRRGSREKVLFFSITGVSLLNSLAAKVIDLPSVLLYVALRVAGASSVLVYGREMSTSSEASPLLRQDILKEEIIVLSPGPLDVVSDHLLLVNKGKPSEQLPAAVQSVHLTKTYPPFWSCA